MDKRIILQDGNPPQFDGQWTVGEVLQMADALARWVQSLAVNAAPPQEPPHAAKDEHE
jgi:hypothetical protein